MSFSQVVARVSLDKAWESMGHIGGKQLTVHLNTGGQTLLNFDSWPHLLFFFFFFFLPILIDTLVSSRTQPRFSFFFF